MRKFIALLFFASFAFSSVVYVAKVDAAIHPITADYILRVIGETERNGKLVVIELNTPGGLDTSMRKIMKRILNANIPVVVYIYPSGARAASAGFFISLSADFVAMAPGTNMGAAHPVAMGQKMGKVMSEKVAQDASALIRSLAEKRGRDVKMAEEAVKKSRSFDEKEALKYRLADAEASDLGDLLKKLNGKILRKINGRQFKLNLTNVNVMEVNESFRERFLTVIANPSLAYFLLMIGLLGLYFEFSHPGAIVPGVVGGISLILAFFAFQILPINIAGLILILMGIGLFIAEAKVQSFGILGIGGGVALFIGSVMLVKSPDPSMRPSLSVIASTVIAITAIVIFLIYLIARAIREKPVTGAEGIVGEEGEVYLPIKKGRGKVFVHGEIWNAESKEDIEKGETIIVVGVKGMRLSVKRKD